jgi:diguanylate cyclase (GGDEF)-like protein
MPGGIERRELSKVRNAMRRNGAGVAKLSRTRRNPKYLSKADFALDAGALAVVFGNLRQGAVLIDSNLRLLSFNSRFCQLFDFTSHTLSIGAAASDLVESLLIVKQENIPSARRLWDTVKRRLRARSNFRHNLPLRDGRTLEVSYAPVGAVGWLITFDDVSARTKAEAVLEDQNERLDAAMRNIPHGVCMFDRDRKLIFCNKGYQDLYALPPDLTVAGTSLRQILQHREATGCAPVDMSTYFAVVGEAEAAKAARLRRIELQDGRMIRVTHNPMTSGAYVAMHEDISEAVRSREHIRFLGSHDSLTGLPNRTLLRERMTDALSRSQRGEMFCIQYVDLDHFKSVNDTHGHSVGDLLLKQAVERMLKCVRECDTLARVGGDEFVVVQTGLHKPDAASIVAQRLINALTEPFDLEGREVFLGASIGLALCPNDGADVDSLLKSADLAMYQAKSAGRNTFRFFEMSMNVRLQERHALELDLRQAIAAGEFELHYQPQVSAVTSEITGCEALLRWPHPIRGMVAPADFIPLAEETGLIVPLGAWVIGQACRDAAGWPDRIRVAVNLSAVQFRGLALVQTIMAALATSGLAPHRLEVEITESVLLGNNENTIATLKLLRALGVRIAMDDFGTGYSSLSYLRSFPFDKIKIDRSFVKDLDAKSDCLAIVKAVAGLGVALGMETTAEGVETLEQLRHIQEQGCTEVQGYFFGRPCPIAEFNELLASRGPGRDAQGREVA